MRFVIADDMHTPRAVLRRILSEAHHEIVAEAKNGNEALQLCIEHKPDAVIFDISMPGGDSGDVAARKVRAALPNVKIFLSSNISDDDIRRPLERDIDAHFVVKPFRPGQLLKELAQYLGA
jgi:CheY-like chemotaxis protein